MMAVKVSLYIKKMPFTKIRCKMSTNSIGGESMNLRVGLKGKIRITSIIIVLIILVSCVVTVNRGINLTKQLLGQQAYKAAETAFGEIDQSKIEAVIRRGNNQHPYYGELQSVLRQVKNYLGLDFLYIMTRNSKGEYIYIVDGSFPEEEGFSNYGDVETDKSYYPNFERVMEGEVVTDDFENTETWGSLVSAYIPIKNEGGTVVGFLGADIDGTDTLRIIKKDNIFMTLFLAVLSLIGIASAAVMSYRITSPITQLRNYYVKISKGEYVNPLKLKSGDETEDLANVLNSRIAAVKNLLNNTEQGFLTFGSDMIIDPEYSLECINIFKTEIENKKFFELVYPEDKEQQRFLESVLEKVLREKNVEKRAIYTPLLSDEVVINGRNICLEYKIINSEHNNASEKFMAILTDITHKRALEERIEREKDTFKMVAKIIINHSDFVECIKEYKLFCKDKLEHTFPINASVEDIVYEIFRTIHTFKGNFAHLDMNNVVEGLSRMEDELSRMKKDLLDMKPEEIRAFMSDFNMLDWLDKDMSIIKQIMGEQFVSRFLDMECAMLIDKGKLIELEKKILKSISPVDCKWLLPELRRLRSRSFKELMKVYPSYVEKLSERMGKQVKLMTISGGDFPVISDKYNDFARALTHVFRNALDHGIESVDERIFRGKEEYAKILCSIKVIEEKIVISIRDDGRGIDIEKIRQKAVEKGLLNEATAYSVSKDEIINFIFNDDFTTKQNQTEFSGRGLGLSAVKKEVEKINGLIEVKTKAGMGTEFIFYLPLYKDIDGVNISIDKIMKPLLKAAGSFVSEQLKTPIDIVNPDISKTNLLKLKEYAAFTSLKGVLDGQFIISLDETLAKAFAHRFSMANADEEVEEGLVEASISECLNIILGNSLKMFPELEDYVVFASPATAKSNYISIKYPDDEVWYGEMKIGEGSLSVSYVVGRIK